jgi:hypothetical protein
VDGDNTGLPVGELTVVQTQTTEKLSERTHPIFEGDKPPVRQEKPERNAAPTMRSYSWALSGDFNAKMDLFGEAKTEEDIDALVACRRVTITRLLASKLSWLLAAKSCSPSNSIPI